MKFPSVRPPVLRAGAFSAPTFFLYLISLSGSLPDARSPISWSNRHLCTLWADYFFPVYFFHFAADPVRGPIDIPACCSLHCSASVLLPRCTSSSAVFFQGWLYDQMSGGGVISISQCIPRNAIIRLQHPDALLRSVIIRCSIVEILCTCRPVSVPLGCLDFSTRSTKNQGLPCSKRIHNKNNTIHKKPEKQGFEDLMISRWRFCEICISDSEYADRNKCRMRQNVKWRAWIDV